MKPTAKLRFVERVVDLCTSPDGTVSHGKTVRVLQQLWVPTNEPYGEWLKIKDGVWKDVPCERE